jgi:hypothetical protein
MRAGVSSLAAPSRLIAGEGDREKPASFLCKPGTALKASHSGSCIAGFSEGGGRSGSQCLAVSFREGKQRSRPLGVCQLGSKKWSTCPMVGQAKHGRVLPLTTPQASIFPARHTAQLLTLACTCRQIQTQEYTVRKCHSPKYGKSTYNSGTDRAERTDSKKQTQEIPPQKLLEDERAHQPLPHRAQSTTASFLIHKPGASGGWLALWSTCNHE